MWKVEHLSNKLGYRAKEAPSKTLEVLPCLFLLFIVKCERGEKNLRKNG